METVPHSGRENSADLRHLIEARLSLGSPNEVGPLALLQYTPPCGCHLCRIIKFAASPHWFCTERRGGDAPEVVKGRSA